MPQEEMWDKLFERVGKFTDEVKAATDIAADVEIKAKDAADIALSALGTALLGIQLSFLLWAIDHPKRARVTKDKIVKMLKETDPIFKVKIADPLAEMLTIVCNVVEKERL